MAWKPCVESNRHAITNPRPVTQKARRASDDQGDRDTARA